MGDKCFPYDDDGYGVDVLHDVVRDSVEFHLAGLRDEVVEHLAVNAPVDGIEEEDLGLPNQFEVVETG